MHPTELPRDCGRDDCNLKRVNRCPRQDVMATCGRDFVFLTEEVTHKPVRPNLFLYLD